MIDFSLAQEQKNDVFVKTGIHDFKVLNIAYQPIGTSVMEEKNKDGVLIEFTFPQIRMELQCTKTHKGNLSEGGTIILGILFPVTDNAEKAQKQMNRLLHIFANICSSENKDKLKASLQAIKVATWEEFVAKLAGFKGRSVRYKLVADQKGKYSVLPNYYGGFAEPSDVPFENSTLSYDDDKEGVKKKDASKVEIPGALPPGAVGNPLFTAPQSDDLPY